MIPKKKKQARDSWLKEYLYFYEQRTRYDSKLIVLTREKGRRNISSEVRIISLSNSNSFPAITGIPFFSSRQNGVVKKYRRDTKKKKGRKKYRNSLKQLTTRMECSARTNRRWRNRFQSTTFSEVPASFRVCFHSNFPLLKSDLVQSWNFLII